MNGQNPNIPNTPPNNPPNNTTPRIRILSPNEINSRIQPAAPQQPEQQHITYDIQQTARVEYQTQPTPQVTRQNHLTILMNTSNQSQSDDDDEGLRQQFTPNYRTRRGSCGFSSDGSISPPSAPTTPGQQPRGPRPLQIVQFSPPQQP